MCDHHNRNKPGEETGTLSLPMQHSGNALAAPARNIAKTPQPDPSIRVQPARRRKLWELEEKLHCPVIGTCISLDELKKVARKEGFSGRGFDAYRLHVEAVSASCTRNSASEMMHKLLERKFARWIKLFDQAKSDAAVCSLWQEHLAHGQVAGPMWAALTHKAASQETVDKVYGDMHMLSHQVGAGLAADARRLEYLEHEVNRLGREARENAYRTNQMLTERATRIRYLETENQRHELVLREMPELKARAAALESGQEMVDLRRRLLLLETANARLEEALQKAQPRAGLLEELAADNSRLKKEVASLSAEQDMMERLMLSDVPGKPSDHAACCGECGRYENQLQGRCILCVGGRVTLLPQYRELAERLGVRLIHHDGGQEEAMSRLPDLLAASDAVICPTDCVSHTAYYQLKRHCKAHGKPCVLTKSGIAGFAAALTRLADGKVMVQGA
ncbi:MAG: DUF2325 domain-containing protein [Pseudomonadota bacterium]|jgi:hypothetical protein